MLRAMSTYCEGGKIVIALNDSITSNQTSAGILNACENTRSGNLLIRWGAVLCSWEGASLRAVVSVAGVSFSGQAAASWGEPSLETVLFVTEGPFSEEIVSDEAVE